MTLLAAGLVAGLVAPHLWPRRMLGSLTGVALWLAVLALRAVMAVSLAILLVLYLPATQLFHLVTHWCLHGVLPFAAVHLGLSGHLLGDAALLVPALVVATSVVSAVFAAWRTARLVSVWARSSSLGGGPRQSVVVGGSNVLVAAAGLRRPRVVISAGALAQLDDDELAAGLEHEWGHINRQHRYLALAGQMLLAVGRVIPGSRRASDELHFHLERDADEYAVRKTGDPLALASAICKSALREKTASSAALATLAGSAGSARLEPLLDRSGKSGRLAAAASAILVLALIALVLALALATPTLASVGLHQFGAAPAIAYCA